MKKQLKIVIIIFSILLFIFLIQKLSIFWAPYSQSNSIKPTDSYLSGEIKKIFEKNTSVVIYPTNGLIRLKKGDEPAGFGLALKNNYDTIQNFTYVIFADEQYNIEEKCGINFETANSFIMSTGGTIELVPQEISEAKLITFKIPKSAPSCGIPYIIIVQINNETIYNGFIYMEII